MTKHEAVGELAEERFVERTLSTVAGRSLDPSLKDLAQNIYAALLGQPEERIAGMAARGELRWFAARMVVNQYRSKTSPYYYTYRRWSERAVDIDGMNISDEHDG